MPVCQKCSRYVADGQSCRYCISSAVVQTAVEPVCDPIGEQSGNVVSLRPVDRPPVPRLIVIDDDSDFDGECFRLRQARTSIGRKDAEIKLPHDPDLSSLHAVILRTIDSDGLWQWKIADQNSKNGTFVRVHNCELVDGDHFRIGDVSFRLIFSNTGAVSIQRNSAPFEQIQLPGEGPWTLGSNSTNSNILVNSQTVDPLHATLRLQSSETTPSCHLIDEGSLNGIWIKVQEWELLRQTEFILGQQRFRFGLPGDSVVTKANRSHD